ncbi:MAG: FecR domain-containing protein [Bacteroidota bacterium]
MNHNDWARIVRYLDGEGSPDEQVATERWLDADPERRAALGELRRLDAAARAAHVASMRPDVAQANRDAIRRRVTLDDRPAASRSASKRTALRVAAAFVAATVALLVWLNVLDEPPEAPLWTTGADETRTVTLADGSTVRLEGSSALTQPDPDSRQYVLSGAARFQVVPNTERPFTVGTAHGEVRVLGTTFTVQARPEAAQMSVAVEEGRVAVRSLDAPGEVVLTAGQEGSAQAGQAPTLGSASVSLRFDGVPLDEVAQALSQVHRIPVRIADPALSSRLIATDLTGLSLDEAAEVLQAFFNITVEQRGTYVALTPAKP